MYRVPGVHLKLELWDSSGTTDLSSLSILFIRGGDRYADGHPIKVQANWPFFKQAQVLHSTSNSSPGVHLKLGSKIFSIDKGFGFLSAEEAKNWILLSKMFKI